MSKNVKWIAAVTLILALLLAGCGESAADVGGRMEPVETEAADTPVSLGRMEGGVYTNSYAGFGCTLDSAWSIYGAEELQELPDNVAEVLKDSEIGEAMSGMEQIVDMMAENQELLSSMNVNYQKLEPDVRLAYALMTDEQIVDAVLEQSQMLIDTYTQAGMDVTLLEKTTVNFLGEERVAVRTEGSMYGADFFMIQVFNYHAGSYSVTLTLTSYIEDHTAEMLALFYPVE